MIEAQGDLEGLREDSSVESENLQPKYRFFPEYLVSHVTWLAFKTSKPVLKAIRDFVAESDDPVAKRIFQCCLDQSGSAVSDDFFIDLHDGFQKIQESILARVNNGSLKVSCDVLFDQLNEIYFMLMMIDYFLRKIQTAENFEEAEANYVEMKNGFKTPRSQYIYNAWLQKCSSHQNCLKVYSYLSTDPDIALNPSFFNAWLKKCRDIEEILSVFTCMCQSKIEPNNITMASFLGLKWLRIPCVHGPDRWPMQSRSMILEHINSLIKGQAGGGRVWGVNFYNDLCLEFGVDTTD